MPDQPQISHTLIDGIELFSLPAQQRHSATPLLFLHGAFAGGWMWTETFMPFFAAAGYDVHALSLRGHGGSAGRDRIDWHSVADYVEDLGHIVRHIEAESGATPALIGHSMGGFIVQKYLEKATVPAAVLLCSVPPQGLVAAQFHLLFQKPELFMDINRIMGGSYTDTAVLREALFAGEADETMLHAWLSRMQTESHRALWDMSVFNLPLLQRAQLPPLLVAGAEKDVLVPAFLVQATAQTYGQQAHIFRDMGHAVTHEHDWPRVAGDIATWLNGVLIPKGQ